MTTPSKRTAFPLSASEGTSSCGPRETVMGRSPQEKPYHFTTPSGVKVVIVDRGNRGWFFNLTLPWTRTRVRHLITKGSRDEAVRLAAAEIEELYKSHAKPATPTLLSVAAELLVAKRREGRAASYMRKLEEHLRGYIAPALGADTPVGAITAKDLLAFKHSLGSSDLDPESCNRILTTLRQILKFAEDPAGYISAPALPRNFRSASWKKRERWQILNPAELAKMLELAPDEVRPILGYVANTGLRIGTALATEVDWIDFENRRVRYPASAMKGRHPHVVELGVAAEMFLRQALEASPEKPFPFSYWFVLSRWVEIREQLGKPTLRIHDLRHSFISNQLAAGTPAHVVKDMAAHRSLAVTSLYSHSSDEARKAAADRVQVGSQPATTSAKEVSAPKDDQASRRKAHLRVVK